jgi:cytoskeletal protein CcmA (bactofilin family)
LAKAFERFGTSDDYSMTTIGPSFAIRGELTSEEDLVLDGRVDGPVTLRGGTLTIGESARLHSEVRGVRIIIRGQVDGNVTATERIELHSSARVSGSLSANLVVIAEGATFNGPIDMGQRTIVAKVAQYKAAAVRG